MHYSSSDDRTCDSEWIQSRHKIYGTNDFVSYRIESNGSDRLLFGRDAYTQQYKFLTNESTDEYLVFQWRPTVDGQFPSGVLMNIKITLPFFGTMQYRFDMTPSEYVLTVFRRNLDEAHTKGKR
jgi:hypothetical protein